MASNKQRPSLAALKAENARLLQEIQIGLKENHAYKQRSEQKEAMRREYTAKIQDLDLKLKLVQSQRAVLLKFLCEHTSVPNKAPKQIDDEILASSPEPIARVQSLNHVQRIPAKSEPSAATQYTQSVMRKTRSFAGNITQKSRFPTMLSYSKISTKSNTAINNSRLKRSHLQNFRKNGKLRAFLGV